MKKIVIILISVLIIWVSMWDWKWSQFCNNVWNQKQKAPVCSQTSKVIEKYLEDMVYVINKIQPSSKKWNFSWLWAKELQPVLTSFETIWLFAWNWIWWFFDNFKILFDFFRRFYYLIRKRSNFFKFYNDFSNQKNEVPVSELKK